MFTKAVVKGQIVLTEVGLSGLKLSCALLTNDSDSLLQPFAWTMKKELS